MNVYYNPQTIEKIKGTYLVFDTNVLGSYSSDVEFFKTFNEILIISRLASYKENCLFITLDKSDFSTLLFDRIAILTFERKVKAEVLEHIQLLRFNQSKYRIHLSDLPS